MRFSTFSGMKQFRYLCFLAMPAWLSRSRALMVHYSRPGEGDIKTSAEHPGTEVMTLLQPKHIFAENTSSEPDDTQSEHAAYTM